MLVDTAYEGLLFARQLDVLPLDAGCGLGRLELPAEETLIAETD